MIPSIKINLQKKFNVQVQSNESSIKASAKVDRLPAVN